jgi:hypothetical protein
MGLLSHGRAFQSQTGLYGKGEPQISPLRYPGFPVEFSGVGDLHAAFLNESRTRGHVQRYVAGNPGRDDKGDSSVPGWIGSIVSEDAR